MRNCVLALLWAFAFVSNSSASVIDDATVQRAFIGFKQALPADIADELNLAGVTHGLVFPSINSVAVTAPHGLLKRYAADPRVRGVRLQGKLDMHLYSSVEQMNARGVEQVPPSGEHPAVTGRGVTVGVVDTGVWALHPDLIGRVLEGYNFEFSLLERQAEGVLPAAVWDNYVAASGALALQDDVGHGTHVAGTIGGDGTAASGLDLRGVAPGVKIIAFKIGSPPNGVVVDAGFEANVVATYDFILRHPERFVGMRVTNNSWGILASEAAGALGPTDFNPIREAIAKTVEAGIVTVFSAGNDGPGPETIRPIPNGMDEVITVAAACKAVRGSCADGLVTGFSSRGAALDITAPGDQILAAMAHASVLAPIGQTLEGSYFGDAPQDQAVNRANYIRLSGTSMSSPHIAGVVALILEVNPYLSPAQVEDVLTSTANDMVVEDHTELLPGFDLASGYGMVNTRAALIKAAGMFGEMPAEDVEPEPDTKDSAVAASVASASAAGGGALAPGLLLMILLLPVLRRARH